MNKIFFLKAVFFCIVYCFFTGNVSAEAVASGAGERIVYAISPMGIAEYNDLGFTELEGKQVHFTTFRTQVIGFDDTEKIYSDTDTFLPLRVERDIKKITGDEYIVEEYDPVKFLLDITKFKSGKVVEKLPFSSDGPIHNAILLPFSLRKVANLDIGWKTYIRLPNKFEVRLTSIEKIKVPAGEFIAYHFTSSPAQFEIWISCDKRRLPLKIKDTGGLGYSLLIKEYKKL